MSKKINNGIGDLKFLAVVALFIVIITMCLNVWKGIKISVDTYVENQNNTIVDYTKEFIEKEKDEDVDRDDIEYIKTKKDANIYMISYISNTVLALVINIMFIGVYYQLINFFGKENMENPYDKKTIIRLKKSLKFLNASAIIWLVGTLLIEIVFLFAPARYSSMLGFNLILYATMAAFIQFIIFILEKGQLKKTPKKESN